jgi:mono/diheme cytochrome c family protein
VSNRFAVLVLAAVITGCASAPPANNALPSAAVARGAAIAKVRCAACHAVDLIGTSGRPRAPPFRDIQARYNDVSFEREMDRIAAGNHNQMPPLRLERDQIHDVAAYIQSLGAP